ncbi:MAG TPA: ATP-binding protein [Pilimelia sp.]|nr:ATP-binding protein [Pilimelia sp.]
MEWGGHRAGGQLGRVAAGEPIDHPEPAPAEMRQEAADALAAVTARAARAPTAMVHLIDSDGMRLVGGVGLPEGWHARRRVPLSSTLAGVVVREGCPLIVEDVATDDRVPADAPLRAVGARAYAGFPIRDADETILGVCAVMDTRPRRWQAGELAGVDEGARACTVFAAEQRAGERADRARRFLDALLESLQVGVAAVDADGRLAFTNEALRRIAGGLPTDDDLYAWARTSTVADATGRPLPPQAMPLVRALRGEHLRDVENVIDRPGERPSIVLIDAQPITGGDGEPLGAVLAAHDVTDLRRAERFRGCELAVSEALAQAASVEQAGPRVLQAIAATLGWPHAELWLVDDTAQLLRSTAVYDAPGHERRVAVPDSLARGHGLAGRAWHTNQPVWVRDVSTDAAAGSAVTVAGGMHTAVAVPVPSGGRVLAVLSFFADVVEEPEDLFVTLLQGVAAQVGQFLERRRAEELTLALTRTTDEYLALVGHEMRTPLTSIAAYASLLRGLDDSQLGPQARQMVSAVERNTDQLRHIVEELLDLAALDTGHATLSIADCDLARLVRDAVAAARERLPEKLVIDCTTPPSCVIAADARRLRQVVDALLANAALYSPDGGTVTVTLDDAGGAVTLTVADTGIGIPPDEQDRLFTRFYRSSRTRDRRIPGAGLGLAISRAIVERHHGSIRLLPECDPGTCVEVRLPASPPAG